MRSRRQVEELLGERLGEVLEDVDRPNDSDQEVVVVDERHVPELAGLHELHGAPHRLVEVQRVRVVDHQRLDRLRQVGVREGDAKREEAETQEALLRDKAFKLAADPTRTSGDPTALDRVPHFNLAPLEDAVDRLKRSAKAYDEALAKQGPSLAADRRARLQDLMQTIDQTLTLEVGLPGRPWYRHMIYAPGRLTGYGAKTLPGVREAIEDRRWADADRYAKLTADALNAYSDRLDQAAAVLKGS